MILIVIGIRFETQKNIQFLHTKFKEIKFSEIIKTSKGSMQQYAETYVYKYCILAF